MLIVELKKIISDVKVYWFNYIFGNLNALLFFAGLFYAFNIDNSNSVDTIVFLYGFLVWYFGSHAINLISIIINEEKEEGTLEQVLLTKVNFRNLLINRMIAQFLFDTVKSLLVVSLLILFIDADISVIINFKGLLIILILILTVIGVIGIGFLVAGFALKYNRVASISAMASNFIIFFSGIIISVNQLPAFIGWFSKTFPIIWSANIIESILQEKPIDGFDFSMFVVTIIFWNILGHFFFTILFNKTIESGHAGSY